MAARSCRPAPGATTIATSGTLNNDGGRIASNGQDLTLQAASIGNASGKIEHAGTGTLAIAGGSFNGTNGQITDQRRTDGRHVERLHPGRRHDQRQADHRRCGLLEQSRRPDRADQRRCHAHHRRWCHGQQRGHARQQRQHKHRRRQPGQPGRHHSCGRDLQPRSDRRRPARQQQQGRDRCGRQHHRHRWEPEQQRGQRDARSAT
jgi:adhesin HecA-like repeat protein